MIPSSHHLEGAFEDVTFCSKRVPSKKEPLHPQVQGVWLHVPFQHVVFQLGLGSSRQVHLRWICGRCSGLVGRGPKKSEHSKPGK